jgi:DNA sulfur modification protein DndD
VHYGYPSIQADFNEDGLGNSGVIDALEEAEEFLERRLPRDIVSFFFYDGEKIQQLAEANQDGLMKNIEKLVGLAAVDTLDVYLERAIRAWNRDGTLAQEQAVLDKMSAIQQLKKAERAKAQADVDDVEAELENLDRDIRRHERYIQTTRTLAAQSDTPRQKEKAIQAAEQYETLCKKVASTLPPAAPLWAVPGLVQQVANMLDGAVGDSTQRLAEEMQDVFDILPGRLFDEPTHPSPPLSDPQKKHYRAKLAAILKQFTEPPSGGFFSLNPAETTALQRQISYYAQARNERQRFADDLREASRLHREWQHAKAEVDAVDELSPEQQQHFRERQAALADLQGQRDTLLIQRGTHGGKIAVLDTDIVRLAAEIRQQETKRTIVNINSQNIQRAQQARRVFDEYRLRLKAQRHDEIECALNRCFGQLMTSHHLIADIKLSEDFALSYHDAHGGEIGLANVSAGMKQLTAQALLWALSEVSGRGIPVIVDTPLARIDRQHQENLLRNYYPNAAQQVIVLPTDSELDREKYILLKPRVNAEFRLDNPDGDRTQVVQNTPMYSVEEA